MSDPNFIREAERQLTICNACRYCEGYCAMFPALELRTAFREGDITYLANLCHDCRNCYDACMYTPPHEFAINIPKLLAEERVTTYERYSWPALFSRLFRHSALGIAALFLFGIVIVFIAIIMLGGPARLLARHTGPGAFYEIVPHLGLVIPAIVVSLYGLVVVLAGAWEFSKDTHGSPLDLLSPGALWRATSDAVRLRWLGGGGGGCYYPATRGTYIRPRYHAFVFWGFIFAFISTTLAAIYQELFGLLPPYPVFSAPVLFGSVGGLMMIVGSTGLLLLKFASDKTPAVAAMTVMDIAFLVVIDLISITGMLTLIFRGTRAMGVLLALHLGILAGFYVTAPYSKFVHFVYRYLALIKHQVEQESLR